jgi:protein TonB
MLCYNILIRAGEDAQPAPRVSPAGRPPTQARGRVSSIAWTVSAIAHGIVLAAALVLVRSTIPVTPPEPATVEMAFLAPPAPAETASEASQRSAETALEPQLDSELPPQPAPAPDAPSVLLPPPEPTPPVPQQHAQTPAPAVEAPLAWKPVHAPEHPASQKAKPMAVQPLGPPPAKPEAPAEAPMPASTLPAPSLASTSHPEEAHATLIDGGWMQAVGAWLAAHKRYPDEARQRGEEGRLAVRFTMDRSGQVTAVQVVRGSGSEALDQAAVTMLRGATLPPLPGAMPQPTITVTVQIRFELRQ